MPIEKGFFRICGKTGRIVGFNGKWRWCNRLFPIIGLLALLWFLLRVIPKPSRANYPCQRAAMPLALGGLAYFLSLFGVVAGFRQARKFLRANRLALAAVCLVAGLVSAAMVLEQNATNARAASVVTPNAPIGIARGINPGRVVWSYDPAACLWSGNRNGTHWWDSTNVDQVRVDAMLSAALRSQTCTTNDHDAWDALFRSFNRRRGNGNISYAQSPRQSIAIKINQNSCNYYGNDYYALNAVQGCGDEYTITANPHLLLAVVRQLTAFGVAQTNIMICDPTGLNHIWGGPRTIGDNIYRYITNNFPSVRFVDAVGKQGRELGAWPSTNNIVYPPNSSGEDTRYGLSICRQILEAGFLINMAIMKNHFDGPTLCAKNHYGSISGQRHGWGYAMGPTYGTSPQTYYSNLVPLMGHPELGEKTLLFMIDALYGASASGTSPNPNTYPTNWMMSPFNTNWPSSVFLSEDGVAIDSVGFDFMNREWGMPQNTDYYLHEAAYVPGYTGTKLSGCAYQPNPGSSMYVGSLGVHEHWNNSTNKQYSRNLGTGNGIELVKLMPGVPSVTLAGLGAGSFWAGTNLAMQAVVINSTNPINQVVFYQGSQVLGTGSGSGCGITWSNVPAGNYLLKVVATDSRGLSWTSNPVNITLAMRVDLAAGLLAYWAFNGDFVDASGHGHDGSAYGTTSVPDWFNRSGMACGFIGTDGCLDVTAPASLQLTNAISIAAWINFSGGGAWNPRIVSYAGNYPFNFHGYELMTVGNGAFRQLTFSFGNQSITSFNTLPERTWHFVVATATSNALSLYINGSLDSALNAAPGGFNYGGAPMYIGNKAVGFNLNDDAWGGAIDEVRIYNRALSAEEVRQLYLPESLAVRNRDTLEIRTVPGRSYQLEDSTNLRSWQPYGSWFYGNVLSNISLFTTQPVLFYRLHRLTN